MCRTMVDRIFATEHEIGADFDMVHAHDWLTANAVIRIKQGRGNKCIQTIRSTEAAAQRCHEIALEFGSVDVQTVIRRGRLTRSETSTRSRPARDSEGEGEGDHRHAGSGGLGKGGAPPR